MPLYLAPTIYLVKVWYKNSSMSICKDNETSESRVLILTVSPPQRYLQRGYDLFEDINRFEALQEDTDQIVEIDTGVERCPKPVELKTGLIENASFRKVHRALRDQGQETNVKQARTREFLEKSFYQKFGSGIRKEAVSKKPEKKISVIHFLGSWKPVNSRVKGHACSGSLKKLEQTLKAPEPDKLYTIDEYNTTKTCGYCFKKIQIHKYRRDGKIIKVKAKISFWHSTTYHLQQRRCRSFQYRA
ncbi:hypothetical protein VTP01DRAFT_548 [Rhizomucor pusillus]|uniref:uncharacterized protein n=1 Tax=Rhizomucor pusillus TaxID=4840 RepID=UPI003742B377